MFPSPSTSNCLKAPRTSSIVLHRPRNLAIIAPGLTPRNLFIYFLNFYLNFILNRSTDSKCIRYDYDRCNVRYFLIWMKICYSIEIKLIGCQLNYFRIQISFNAFSNILIANTFWFEIKKFNAKLSMYQIYVDNRFKSNTLK